MLDGTDLYALDINGASFVKACGGPCTEGCVTLARIGDGACADWSTPPPNDSLREPTSRTASTSNALLTCTWPW